VYVLRIDATGAKKSSTLYIWGQCIEKEVFKLIVEFNFFSGEFYTFIREILPKFGKRN
jgi:hypothetical protein